MATAAKVEITMTQSISLRATGKMIPFADVHIGQPYYAYGKFWSRSSYNAGTEIRGSDHICSTCNFMTDDDGNHAEIMVEEVIIE